MSPVHFPQVNRTFVSPGAEALPAHASAGIVTSCWRLTWRERLRLLRTGRLWAQTATPLLGIDVNEPRLPWPRA